MADYLLEVLKIGVGAVGGFIAKLIYDRNSDLFLSEQTLIEKLSEGKPISHRGLARLHKYVRTKLDQWRAQFPMPPHTAGASTEVQWPSEALAFCTRAVTDSPDFSHVPRRNTPQPLFIRIREASDVAQALSVLGSELSRVGKAVSLSEQLLKLHLNENATKEHIWLAVPDVILRDADALIALTEGAASAIRSWVPHAKLIVEGFLPDDVAQEFLTVRTGSLRLLAMPADGSRNTLIGDAALYVNFRRRAMQLLSKGCILGRTDGCMGSLSVPEELVASRLEGPFDEAMKQVSAGSDAWTTLGVFGPPGSGKTQLAHYILNQLVPDGPHIALDFSTPDVLEALQGQAPISTRKEAITSLAGYARRLAPAEFLESDISLLAFEHACYKALACNSASAILFFDNLYDKRETRQRLLALRQNAEDFKVHFVLVDRSGIEAVNSTEKFVSLQCDLWNRDEARRILNVSFTNQRGISVGDYLSTGWPRNQQRFSTYLLDLMAHQFDIHLDASSLLQRAIARQIEPVDAVLKQVAVPAEKVIDKIKTLLAEDAPVEALVAALNEQTSLDAVELLGQLSWVSRFDKQEAIFTTSALTRWSRGRLSEEAAERLLSAGSEAGIFLGDRRAKAWRNNLVADGCAALYLAKVVGTASNATVAEMVDQLGSSVEILQLVLDVELLLRIIDAIVESRLGMSGVIAKIVTEQFISRVSEQPEFVDALADRFVRQARNATPEQLVPLASVLARILPASPHLQTFLTERVTAYDNDATLAIASFAAARMDEGAYIDEIAKLGADIRTAFGMACRFWSYKSQEVLVHRAIALYQEGIFGEETREAWSSWCGRLKGPELMDAVAYLVNVALVDNQDLECALLLDPLLQGIGKSRLTASQLSTLRLALEASLCESKPRIATSLVKCLAHGINRDLVPAESKWIILKDAAIALPKAAYPPSSWGEIIRRALRPPHFSLPHSKELAQYPGLSSGEAELISDGFPEGFEPGDPLYSRYIMVWDGVRAAYPEAANMEALKTLKFVWRPRFSWR